MLGWELPPHNSGGLGIACYHMSKAMAVQGATIDFVVPYSASHPNTNHMTVHAATPQKPQPYGSFGAYNAGKQVATKELHNDLPDTTIRGVQARYVKFVEGLTSRHTHDVIHAHDWLTMEAGVRAKELTGAPLVLHVHSTEYDRAGAKNGNPLVHEIELTSLMMADKIIAVSEATKRIIIEKYHIPANKIDVVYNGFDATHLEAVESRDESTYRYLQHLRNNGHTIVGTLTRFTVQKGLSLFLQAAARASQKHNKFVFLLAGDGEQRDELISLAAHYGIADKVFFTGFVRGKQWRDAYDVLDVFVMSSVSEPFGLTALEAAHYNCALVLTHQSGVSEVVRNTLKYDFWDTERLADQLVNLAQNQSLLPTLIQNSHKEYASISWHDVARKCIKIFSAPQLKSPVTSEATL